MMLSQQERGAAIWGAAVCVITIVIDQLSKLAIVRTFDLHETRSVISGFFDICYVRNEGAAWGMFAGYQMALALFALLCICLFLVFRKKIFGEHPSVLVGLGLLTGGIIGNVIDRIRLGYVIDFIDVHWYESHFPCFNVADSAICISVVILFLIQWITDKKESFSA